jgi:hypothetical protein
MSARAEHQPGDPAPETGRYRLLNVFGRETRRHVHVVQGHPLPDAPMRHTWRLVSDTDENDAD